MADALCELRQDGKGTTPQAETLAREIRNKIGNLEQAILHAVMGVDKAGLQQTAHTVQGRLEQACRWLQNPDTDDKGLGQRAIALIVDEGKRVAEGLPGHQRAEIHQLCDEVQQLAAQFSKLCAQGKGRSPEGLEVSRKLNAKLHELKQQIQNAVVNRVVEDFIDISTPLKQFTEAISVPEGTPGREANFTQKSNNLQAFSDRASKTSRIVAAGGSVGNKKLAEVLLSSAAQIDSLTPQLISAGRIRMNYPQSKAADEHFTNLKQQYADTILRMRTLCDQATDPSDFIRASEEQMQKHSFLCEEAIRQKQPQKMVENTSAIARLANRVLLVANQEAENSEDPEFIANLSQASGKLQNSVPPMVQDAKAVATNISDPVAASNWRDTNKNVSEFSGKSFDFRSNWFNFSYC
jgi:vinculin